jgi:isochorismate synthase
MPLKNSFDFIKEVEGSQRKNYTGFIGLNFANNQQLFVNLRCMQILKNNFLVYVGAGVTKDSIPENEWFETENKSMTLLKML